VIYYETNYHKEERGTLNSLRILPGKNVFISMTGCSLPKRCRPVRGVRLSAKVTFR